MVQNLKNYLWHWPKAVFFSAWYGWPARRLTIIGVTGTKGKTTTAHMIYHILRNCLPGRGPVNRHPPGTPARGPFLGAPPRLPPLGAEKIGLISTIGAFFGDEEIDTGLHVTSPDPRELQRLLRLAADKGLTHVVLEVTSNGLDQFRVWGIKFKVAVITNIYPDHLDYHGTMEKYAAAKGKIIGQSEVVVLPKSLKYFDELEKSLNQGPRAKGQGPRVIFFLEGESIVEANKAAAMAAAEALFIKDSPWHTPRRILFRQLLMDFKGVKGRLEEVYKNKFSVVVDFAHTPESLAAALGELRSRVGKNGKLIAVFGCAGERDRGRRRMGEVAAKMADFFVITAEDPRSEKVEEISEEIAGWARAGGAEVFDKARPLITKAGPFFIRIPDRQKAINYAISLAKQGDVVGLFGKGHEKSMAFGKKELPWSEYEAVTKALKYVRNIRLCREK